MPYYLWRHEALLLQEFQVCTYTAVVVSVLWSVRTARSLVSLSEGREHKTIKWKVKQLLCFISHFVVISKPTLLHNFQLPLSSRY